MAKQYLLFFIALNLSFLSKPFAQNTISDTGFYRSAIDHIIELYIDSVKDNLRLYNGTEITGGTYRGISGHPFFEYPEPWKGDVFYDGVRYPGMMLSYDLVNDEILFTNSGNRLNIKLNTREVNWFIIANHLFVYLRSDANTVNFPGSGFYELLYEGAGTVLAKRKKQLYQSSKADEATRFIQWNAYYVRKNNVYFTVDSKRALLAACGDRRTEIARFMQKEKLNFRKDPANTIVKVITWYTQFRN